MAKRGGEAALKRNREKIRLEKQEAKREKRSERRSDMAATPIDDEALMEEFARLSERHESGEISAKDYEGERRRILGELGIESSDHESR